jgi:hypothetical protein
MRLATIVTPLYINTSRKAFVYHSRIALKSSTQLAFRAARALILDCMRFVLRFISMFIRDAIIGLSLGEIIPSILICRKRSTSTAQFEIEGVCPSIPPA